LTSPSLFHVCVVDMSKISSKSRNRHQQQSSPILDNAIAILVVARVVGALYNIVHDCDEVYNYWEPLHYVMHGYGMQTWEYSAAYALRSWWYIVLHALIGWPLKLVTRNKVLAFYGIKVALGLLSGCSEYILCRALVNRVHPHVAKVYLVFAAFSSGMFVSANAFLPSSVAMVAMTFSAAGVLEGNTNLVIWGAVVGCTWGWIVAGLAFVPYALWILVRGIRSRNLLGSFGTLFVSLAIALVPLVVCDRVYYGTWKASLVNFLEYNVQGGGKSDLYGVEPASYYLKNGFNQLQMALPLALALPAVMAARAVGGMLLNTNQAQLKERQGISDWLVLVALSPAFLWMVAITSLPHKEERFLYVVYPLLIAAAAVTTVRLKEIMQSILPGWLVRNLMAIGILGTCLLSLSRSRALVHHYGSIMALYRSLPSLLPTAIPRNDSPTYVCTGSEWFKFPSSFFLPGSLYRLQFVKSGFDGLLPRPFEESPDGTKASPPGFNDDNRMVEGNFWDNATLCDYFVTSRRLVGDTWEWIDPAVVDGETAGSDSWTAIAALPYVDNAASPALYRAFSIPLLSERKNVWMEYVLLKNRRRGDAAIDNDTTNTSGDEI
jgi:alpha-1,2-mannosyltransferase